MWHYSGALLHETLWPTGQELYDVSWQTFESGVFSAQPISAIKVDGIKSSQPIASAEPYRPPGARGIVIPSSTATAGSRTNGTAIRAKVESAAAANTAAAGADGAAGADSDGTGAATNRKGRRHERNKARATNFRKKFENGSGPSADVDSTSVSAPELSTNPFSHHRNVTNNNNNTTTTNSPGNNTNGTPTNVPAATATAAVRIAPQLSADELIRLKRTRIVAKKLSDIGKLKSRKERGEHLEVNQLSKITSEADLLKELADLRLA